MPRPKNGTTVLHKRAQSKCTWTWTSQKGTILCRNLEANAVPQNLAAHFARACTVEMHMDISQEQIQEKCRAPEHRRTLCEPARSTTCMDMSQDQVYARIYRKNAGAHRGADLARACAVKTHMDTASLAIRTPQCGHTVWGKKSPAPKMPRRGSLAMGATNGPIRWAPSPKSAWAVVIYNPLALDSSSPPTSSPTGSTLRGGMR